MRKERTLLAIGIFIIVLPFLGFPNIWRTVLFMIVGFMNIYISYLFYIEYKRRNKQDNIKDTLSFVDNITRE